MALSLRKMSRLWSYGHEGRHPSDTAKWISPNTYEEVALILHGIASRWYVVPVAVPLGPDLYAVVATGASTAWADGWPIGSHGWHGLVLRWNGTVWKPATNPLQGPVNQLNGMAADPAGDVWAVGSHISENGNEISTASMLRNGKTWRLLPTSFPNSELFGVAVIPGAPYGLTATAAPSPDRSSCTGPGAPGPR